MVTASGATLNYSYDGLKRLEKTTLKSGDSSFPPSSFSFLFRRKEKQKEAKRKEKPDKSIKKKRQFRFFSLKNK